MLLQRSGTYHPTCDTCFLVEGIVLSVPIGRRERLDESVRFVSRNVCDILHVGKLERELRRSPALNKIKKQYIHTPHTAIEIVIDCYTVVFFCVHFCRELQLKNQNSNILKKSPKTGLQHGAHALCGWDGVVWGWRSTLTTLYTHFALCKNVAQC